MSGQERAHGATYGDRSVRRRVLRACDLLATHIALAVGIASLVFTSGLAATLLWACFFVSVATAAAATLRTVDAHWLRTALKHGTNVGLIATAVLGAVTAFGFLGCLFAVPMLGTHPLVTVVIRSYLRDRFGGGSRSPEVQPGWDDHLVSIDASRESAALDVLDDAALCRVWQESYVQLTSAVSVDARFGIADHRRRCLDELQHRNPDGFAAWLESGARAASDPLPFLRKAMPPPR